MGFHDRSVIFKEHFDKVASRRKGYRKSRSYYWNDITKCCSYFIQEDNAVLEIGAGTGELIGELKAKRKVAIDFSEVMVEVGQESYPDVEYHVMRAENIELDEQFDVVILSNLIGSVADIQQVFKELNKVCTPHTRIIVTYYNYLWEPLVRFAEFVGFKMKTPRQNWLSLNDVNNLLYLAGFDVYRTTKRLLLPLSIPLVSFLLNRVLAKFPFFRYFCLNMFSFARQSPRETEDAVSDKYSVSIVVPARNESGNIEDAILRLPKFGKWTELIFIEGNSTDDTWKKVQEVAGKYENQLTIKIGQQSGKGKGDAVRMGFDMATGDILMILDADLTVPPEDLPKFYYALATGKGEFINGSRLVYTMENQAMRFLNVLGNKFFSVAFSWLLDQKFKDTLCGTKVLFKSDYERVKVNRHFFGDFDPFGDYDLIFGAHKLNLKITELPIRYQQRTYGTTNISRFKHGFLLLRMCMFAARKIKFR
ncbi:MAG: glycosyltransferase [Flavobacteriales bacterium]|nr:glycosyltransferase [Flavobacteriales bacterium]